MSDFDETTKTLNFDAPNSYIGRSVTRPNARRLTQGRGQYVDDIVLPRMVHVAYVRSPHAHARILGIDVKKAAAMPGVVRVVTGAEIALVVKPYVGVLTHLAGMRSPPQYPLAMEVARWQGEPVVAVVAQSRAEAEDAVEAIEIGYEELPAALDAERALDPSEPKIHKEFDSNLCFQRVVDTGGVDAAMKSAHLVVEETIHFGRHTGVTIEPRAILADYNRAEESITVYHCGQSPHMMQGIIASRLSLDEHRVRIVARDVGGSFGIKIHTYGDEIAACALSLMLGRPVKFAADRLESFLSDIHARDHRVRAKLAVDAVRHIPELRDAVREISGSPGGVRNSFQCVFAGRVAPAFIFHGAHHDGIEERVGAQSRAARRFKIGAAGGLACVGHQHDGASPAQRIFFQPLRTQKNRVIQCRAVSRNNAMHGRLQ